MIVMKFRKTVCVLISMLIVLSISGCNTPEEQAEIDAANRERADEIAEEYFGGSFEYDFDFYGGGGEGDLSLYIYVYKDGDKINCVGVPSRENVAGPFVYYDCTLHQYDSGRWDLESYKESKEVD